MSADEVTKRAFIASPCSAKWDEMEGDDKVRYCGQCRLNVFNAAAMTDEEVLDAMVRVTQGKRVCMRMYRRADGTVLTKNCPVGFKQLQERVRKVAGWLAGGLSLLLSSPAAAQSSGSANANAKPNSATRDKQRTNQKPRWHSLIQGAPPSQQPASNLGTAPAAPVLRPPNDLFTQGDVAYPADYQSLTKLFSESLSKSEKAYGRDSLEAARDLIALSNIYKQAENYAASDQCLKRAATCYEKQNRLEDAYRLCQEEYALADSLSRTTGGGRQGADGSQSARAAYWLKRKLDIAARLRATSNKVGSPSNTVRKPFTR